MSQGPQRVIVEDERLEVVLELLKRRNKKFASAFLENKGLPKTGTWGALTERLKDGVRSGQLTVEELCRVLDDAEDEARQHVYLFQCPDGLREQLRSAANVRSLLRRNNMEHLYNDSRPVDKPTTPTLVSVRHNNRLLYMKWAETRKWWEKVNEEVVELEGRRIVEYEQREERVVSILEIDLVSGETEVRIEAIKRRLSPDKEFEATANVFKPFLDLAVLTELSLGAAIEHLIGPDAEIRKLKCDLATRRDSRGKWRSAGRDFDVADDEGYQAVLNSGSVTGGPYLNGYWQEQGTPLTSEVHVSLHRGSGQIVFWGSYPRNDREYVLSRIRALAG